MALNFSAQPFVNHNEAGTLFVSLQDPSAYVDCRVIATALSRKAGSLSNTHLLRAFDRHRSEIEAAANRKFKAKDYDEQQGRIIIWIYPDDL